MKRLEPAKLLTMATLLAFLFIPPSSFAQQISPTAEKPLVLKSAWYIPPTSFYFDPKTGPATFYANEMEKRTGGRVKIKIYYSEALGKAKDHFDIARKGIAEISCPTLGYTPGYFPLSSIGQLPFPAPGMSFSVVSKALWDLNKKGLLDKMFNEVKVLNLDPTAQYQLFLTKKITKTEELKGLKIRSPGGEWPEILKAWGAAPVPVTAADMYHAMSRGIIEGLPMSWAAAPQWKTYEITKYVLEINASAVPNAMVMNLDTWKRLPPDIQKIIDKLNEDFVGVTTYGSEEHRVWGYELYGEKVGRPLHIEKGIGIYDFSPEEKEKLYALIIPLWDKWVKDMEEKGLPGKKVMGEYLAILKKRGAKPPYEPTWK